MLRTLRALAEEVAERPGDEGAWQVFCDGLADAGLGGQADLLRNGVRGQVDDFLGGGCPAESVLGGVEGLAGVDREAYARFIAPPLSAYTHEAEVQAIQAEEGRPMLPPAVCGPMSASGWAGASERRPPCLSRPVRPPPGRAKEKRKRTFCTTPAEELAAPVFRC